MQLLNHSLIIGPCTYWLTAAQKHAEIKSYGRRAYYLHAQGKLGDDRLILQTIMPSKTKLRDS
jgi:hypothetical protein